MHALPVSPDGVESTPTRLLIVRHGQSVWNALGRWQGQADPPLSPEGESQARSAASRLAEMGVDRVFASDLQRARRTAEIIAETIGTAAVVTHPGLREIDVGHWSGLTRQEIEERWPGMLAARAAGRLLTPPGGETVDNLAVRVCSALNAIVAALRETAVPPGARAPLTAVLVSHRGPISALERSVGLKPARAGHLAGHWFEVNAGRRIRHVAAANLLEIPADTDPETL